MSTQNTLNHPEISFTEGLKVWAKVALLSFGGPAGQIGVMHKILVEEKKWIDESKFLNALNFCMLLPGPEAQQLATYLGRAIHGTKGGLVAGGLFILPGFLSILILSILYAFYQDLSFIQAVFFGIKPAILAIVANAVIKIGQRTLKNRFLLAVSILSFVALFMMDIAFPWIILGAGLLGLVYQKNYIYHDQPSHHFELPGMLKTTKTLLLGVFIWFFPIILIMILGGLNNIFVIESLFFSKAALITFGGAYAVLSYIAQKAVEDYAWLRPTEMIDGLGMAETTPGPLIQVVQFVGFMGAFRNAELLDPLSAGVIASLLVTWVTFVPCFTFIFAGAPYVEFLMTNKFLKSAFSAILAAVVGAILNLGIWFALNTTFSKVQDFQWLYFRILNPDLSSFNPASFMISLVAFICLFLLKLDMLKTLMVCLLIGLGVWYLI